MRDRKGFTLIEISIVLVIIGLIVGGILVGQELIRAAEIRGTIKQVEAFQTAVHSFRIKYRGTPGDFNRATTYFNGVIDGNGDGRIHTNSTEGYYVWQHLSAAELWPGEYTHVGPPPLIAGTHVPAAKVGVGHFIVLSSMTFGGGTLQGWYPSMRDRNVLLLGSNSPPNVNNWGVGPVLRPQDAHQIDSKMDDGHPAFGKVQAGRPQAGLSVPHVQCSGDADENLAAYQLNVEAIRCNLNFAIN